VVGLFTYYFSIVPLSTAGSQAYGKITNYKYGGGIGTLSPCITEGEKPVYRLKVKEVAQQKGMSQRQLFFTSHVDLKIIQRIYRKPSETVVTIETLDKLAMALDVDVSELIESVRDNASESPEKP
jgi:DNA-binding Xre family transcriptional regulator